MLTSEGHEQITEVRVTDDELVVALADGRTLSVPLVWYPSLLNASDAQRSDWELIGDGEGVHWPQIDEDLSAEGLLRGIPSSAVLPRPPSPADEISSQIQEQIVNSAKDFYGNTLGQVKGRLESSRSSLECLLEELPQNQEYARSEILELVMSYEELEELFDEVAQAQGVADTVQEAVAEAQGAAQRVAQQEAQDVAGGAVQQTQEAADQTQGAVGQAADRALMSRL